jgi:hypothetical protein
MGQSSPPTAPQRSQFYNVVCGGTWLNRAQYDDAVAQNKSATAVFTDQVAQTLNLQRQAPAPTVGTLPLLLQSELIPVPLRQILQAVLSPFYTPNAAQPQRLPASPLEGVLNRLTAIRQQLADSSAMGAMFSYFFGWRKEAKPASPIDTDDQHARDQTDFLAAANEVFSLNKVGKSSGSNLPGSGGQGGGGGR